MIEQELVSSQEEVHEVMQALEELAVSYDSKDREIESVHTERRLLAEENEEIQVGLVSLSSLPRLFALPLSLRLSLSLSLSLYPQGTLDQRLQELERLRETTSIDKRKKNEFLSSIFREVNEVSSVLAPKSDDWVPITPTSSSSSSTSVPEVSDEDFTRVRVQLSNMRCEARSLTEQRAILEQAERDARDKAQAVMKELSNCRLKISKVPILTWYMYMCVLTHRHTYIYSRTHLACSSMMHLLSLSLFPP